MQTPVLVSFLVNALAVLAQVQFETFNEQQVIIHTNLTAGISNCIDACTILDAALPEIVFLPGSEIFELQSLNYWSLHQSSAKSACRVSPTSAEDVSIALKILEQTGCQFAVKSGGHAPFAGASNINGGVTIDLVGLNEITVSLDHTVTRIGPGNRWSDVYSKLDPIGLSVVGGRTSDIGVGGLVLGGGISYFSGRHGYACDNVLNYEVVLADGSIREVGYESDPDLYFALRGGGNNFGIVTRLDLKTFPQGSLWGGFSFYSEDQFPALIDALVDFNLNAHQDPDASALVFFSLAEGGNMAFVDLVYTKPIANPPILQNLAAIPSLQAQQKINSLTNLTLYSTSLVKSGQGQSFWTFTYQTDFAVTSKILEMFEEEKNILGVQRVAVLQPISTAVSSYFSKNGGNALGFTDVDGPLTLFLIILTWTNEADTEVALEFGRTFIGRANATAYEMGKGHRFVYQNYAAEEQKVFEGYGAENLERLREIRRKYDPKGVFESLQPGYFKL